jgi:hypothetical protein
MSTPPNQASLDAAAADARRVAGDAYYTGCMVDQPDAGRVTLYLAHAPEAILEELEALHPGVYAIINDAPRPYSSLLEIMDRLEIHELKALGIDVVQVGPTVDGYVQVGVLSASPLRAQARLDAIYGCGVIRVFETERWYALAGSVTP